MITTLITGILLGFLCGLIFAELSETFTKAKAEVRDEDLYGKGRKGKRAR